MKLDIPDRSTAIRTQYARWPYPRVPLLATVRSTHPWQLHCDWLWDRCGSGPAPRNPRLWIAGCGTFQPYVFGVANPRAEILATDVSEPSLRLARRRCRLHRVRNVTFAPCDLEDPSSWPDGEFDLIECYGVLMNLRDPQRVLGELAGRLAPGGVLRLMVYPRFSRARIFQLQRLARLCGFHAGDRSHPRRFRALVRGLPRAHPLRHAFDGYHDSRSDAGIVDAFLHAGDRGYTGLELGALIDGAGLEPAYWFHRPWARPDVMAGRLGLGRFGDDFVLGYLDLWQELRQNYVVCLRRRGESTVDGGPVRAHPSFEGGARLRHALGLLRFCVLGGRVPTRTGDGDVVLRPAEARALRAGALTDRLPETARERLLREGLLLGGSAPGGGPGGRRPWRSPSVDAAEFLRGVDALRPDRRAPNPLYAHLFAAFELDRRHPELELGDLETQLGRWLPWASPLEHRPLHFGLTPYATAQRFRINLRDHLQRAPLPVAPGWDAVRLRDDEVCREQAAAFAAANGCPRRDLDAPLLRELWLLVFGHRELFLPLLPA